MFLRKWTTITHELALLDNVIQRESVSLRYAACNSLSICRSSSNSADSPWQALFNLFPLYLHDQLLGCLRWTLLTLQIDLPLSLARFDHQRFWAAYSLGHRDVPRPAQSSGASRLSSVAWAIWNEHTAELSLLCRASWFHSQMDPVRWLWTWCYSQKKTLLRILGDSLDCSPLSRPSQCRCHLDPVSGEKPFARDSSKTRG